jgi:hypothetical protein
MVPIKWLSGTVKNIEMTKKISGCQRLDREERINS